VIAGNYQIFRDLCKNVLKIPISEATFIPPGSERHIGIRFGEGNRLVLSCGYLRDPHWYFHDLMPYLFGYQPEQIACCDRFDLTLNSNR
jgi:hypothetical protein